MMTTDRNDTASTDCWKCNEGYPKHALHCPKCGATNANVNYDAAIAEMEQLALEEPKPKPSAKAKDHGFNSLDLIAAMMRDGAGS